MDRFRGKLLDPEGRTRFEHLELALETHAGTDEGGRWSGSFEPPTASGIIAGEEFRLVLEDGRAQDIEIKAVEDGGQGRPRVVF